MSWAYITCPPARRPTRPYSTEATIFGAAKGHRQRGFVDLRHKKHHVGQTSASGGTGFLLLIRGALTSRCPVHFPAAPHPMPRGIPGMTIETRVNSLWVYPSREGLSHVSATPPVPGNYWRVCILRQLALLVFKRGRVPSRRREPASSVRGYLLANGTMMWVLAGLGKGCELPQRKTQLHVTYPSEGPGVVCGSCGECLANLGDNIIDMG